MTLLRALLSVNVLLTLIATPPASARDDVAEECAKANIGSVASLLGSSAPAFIEASTEQQISDAYWRSGYGPWALAMYPSAKARMGGVLAQIALIQQMRTRVDPGNTLPLAQWFAQVAQSPKPVLSTPSLEFLKSEFNRWRADTYYDGQINSFKAGAPYFCTYFSLFGCVGPVKTILDRMHPHGIDVWSVSMVDLWEKLLTDTEYYPGLAKGSALIYQRITDVRARRDRRGAVSDIFADLVAGYRAVGKSETEARDRAFDVLGVYGTRGASMTIAYSLARADTAPVVAGLTFISSAMSYLDLVQPAGRYYSMPPATTGTCMYGKPYHFWMPAYFVHTIPGRLAVDVKEASIAAHIVGRVYESNSATLGRDPNQAFYEPLLSPHNNQLRANLVINDAGAIWAAENGTRTLNINAAIGLLKSKALPLPTMTPDELTALLRKPIERDKAWIQMFQPDVLIKQWLERSSI
jgi:hypothetical protein